MRTDFFVCPYPACPFDQHDCSDWGKVKCACGQAEEVIVAHVAAVTVSCAFLTLMTLAALDFFWNWQR